MKDGVGSSSCSSDSLRLPCSDSLEISSWLLPHFRLTLLIPCVERHLERLAVIVAQPLSVRIKLGLREERALDNMRRAIDMQEVFERVAIRAHGSYMPHGAVFKTTQDILLVADVQKFRLSKCELQNAVTKRTANSGASRSLDRAP